MIEPWGATVLPRDTRSAPLDSVQTLVPQRDGGLSYNRGHLPHGGHRPHHHAGLWSTVYEGGHVRSITRFAEHTQHDIGEGEWLIKRLIEHNLAWQTPTDR